MLKRSNVGKGIGEHFFIILRFYYVNKEGEKYKWCCNLIQYFRLFVCYRKHFFMDNK